METNKAVGRVPFNVYEYTNRQLKVHALVVAIRATLAKHGLTPCTKVAETIRASWATHSMDFADMAKVNAPSIKTWDMVCDELGK